jgi:hypothetical protein
MRHRDPLPLLYRSLFQITAMRDDVGAMRGDLEDADARRFVNRLDTLEQQAMKLLDMLEAFDNLTSH